MLSLSEARIPRRSASARRQCRARHAENGVQRSRLERRGEREIAGGDGLAFGEQHGALDHALELANVAGPAVCEERPLGTWIEVSARQSVFAAGALEEMFGEQEDIVAPLAQGRDAHDQQTVEEI